MSADPWLSSGPFLSVMATKIRERNAPGRPTAPTMILRMLLFMMVSLAARAVAMYIWMSWRYPP